MKKHIFLVLLALVIGVLGIIVFFTIASYTTRGEVGIITTCALFVSLSALLVRKHPSGWWYIGLMFSIPSWSFFYFVADKGQFEIYFWGLVGILLCSYIGALIGLWLANKNKITQRN